ncbi:hypothetical protein QUA41_00675 [Microcoleus sp. Pol11C1]
MRSIALRGCGTTCSGGIAQYAPDAIGTQSGKAHLTSCDRL